MNHTRRSRALPPPSFRVIPRAGLFSAAILLCFLISLALPPALGAQDSREVTSPRIGLVLSGGGAKGTAHVGVLKVLEEMQVPIDFIVGTSMGAVVGGLYAAGLSPSKMEAVLESIDWNDVFRSSPSYIDLSQRRRQAQNLFGRVEVGVGSEGLKFPPGLIAGHRLSILLQTLTIHAATVRDFDLLPIPFRAVTADLVTGSEVVLGEGNLVEAIRASMSVPGFFSPVELGRLTLVDGGIVNNFPVDVAQAAGVDVVIGVTVAGMPTPGNSIESVFDVSTESIDLVTAQNVQRSIDRLGPDDVFIPIDMTGFVSTNFERSPEFIDLGYRTADQYRRNLRPYSLPDAEWALYLAQQRRPLNVPPRIDRIELVTLGNLDPERFLPRVQTRAGEILDLEVLESDLDRIYGTGYFEQVDFVLEDAQGDTVLVIRAREKSWGPDYLRFGVSIIEDFQGGGAYNVTTEYYLTNLNRLGAEWRVAANVGRTLAVSSDYYQPLHKRELFYVEPAVRVFQEVSDYYDGETRAAQLQLRGVSGSMMIGSRIGSSTDLKVGLGGRYLSSRPLIGSEELPEFSLLLNGLRTALVYDRLDVNDFPKRGTALSLAGEWNLSSLGSDAEFVSVEAGFLSPATFGRHTLLPSLAAGVADGDSGPIEDVFSIGGFPRVSGYRPGQLTGNVYGTAALLYYFRLFRLPRGLGNNFYFGGGLESGQTWESLDDISLRDPVLGFSLFAGVETALGPVYLAYGFAEGSDWGSLYFFLGQVF
jgi:NTE family protein